MENTALRAQIRAHVHAWELAGEELRRMRQQRLRALTEQEAAREFGMLDCDPSLVWRRPGREDGAGLIEQQRHFMKAHRDAPRH